MTLVFQYGSNTSTARLNSATRLQGAARSLGLAQTLEPYELAFTHWSQRDGYAAADLQPDTGRRIYGVLYEIPEERVFRDRGGDRMTLDRIEGEGRNYRRTRIQVTLAGEQRRCWTYLVIEPRADIRTVTRYVKHIVDGLREHDAPAEYLCYVKERVLQNNPDLALEIEEL
jgi:gamma-glutamylcyclotransferase (GGCT)/AIG2-like uncharacterized protein YtfP